MTGEKMKLYYSVNCGKDCEYYTDEHKNEKWKDAKYYDKYLYGFKVSNFGGITKDDKNVPRYLNKDGAICVKINEEEHVLYKIVASTFLPEPDGGYEDFNRKKSVHHRDNNSYNFNPDNMLFLTSENHNNEPHLYRQNFDNWDILIDKICEINKYGKI
jgi:hypothetical protein